MPEITRHFSATTYIIHKNKVLLHFHKKLNRWIPVGGHIDRDELPQDAALREIKEETGLDVELIKPHPLLETQNGKHLISPFYMFLHDLNPFHQHIDMIFFAVAKGDTFNADEGESKMLKWFTLKEIQNNNELTDDVKRIASDMLTSFS